MGLSSFNFVQWAPKDASMLQPSVGRKRCKNISQICLLKNTLNFCPDMLYFHLKLMRLATGLCWTR